MSPNKYNPNKIYQLSKEKESLQKSSTSFESDGKELIKIGEKLLTKKTKQREKLQ